MYERILAIGDIHGEWDKFISLYKQIDFCPQKDLLIFLGDYIDRGPNSLRTLEWMISHCQYENIIMLRGNHEQMMIDFCESRGEDDSWLFNGGDITARELQLQGIETIERCFDFIKGLPLSWQIEISGKKFFFCHAGVKPGIPLEAQDEEYLLWIRSEFYNHYKGRDIVVVGHTYTGFVELGRTTPIIKENMIMVDTGAYMPDGHISCVNVLSGQIWQSH